MRALYEDLAMSRRLNRQRGFTLIELLVVIAIIAILAAIAIPAFNSYRENAQKKAATANARTCLTAMAAYLAENPNATSVPNTSVPKGCTPNGTTKCTCNSPDGQFQSTCEVDSTGKVTCTESTASSGGSGGTGGN